MFTVPAFFLGALILWKEWLLWHYHRTMPPILRLTIVIPGFLLGVTYLVFGYYETFSSGLDVLLRVQVGRFMLTAFFLWNAIALIATKDQHRRDIP